MRISAGNQPWRRVARWGASSLLVAAVAAAWPGCTTGDEDPANRSDEVPGFDEDVDPADLADFEGKTDGDPCANHSGGTLTGDDLLVIVNKEEQRQLRRGWGPRDLMPIDGAYMMPGRSAEVRFGRARGVLRAGRRGPSRKQGWIWACAPPTGRSTPSA